mmetsp:Transcript_3121/g.4819  ORF Transcript_3121/g.4819 Transcript_3121/m.4819 type:complete len:102 (-) Transcript_3121:156-461(-)
MQFSSILLIRISQPQNRARREGTNTKKRLTYKNTRCAFSACVQLSHLRQQSPICCMLLLTIDAASPSLQFHHLEQHCSEAFIGLYSAYIFGMKRAKFFRSI